MYVLKKITTNAYVRATIVVVVLTALAGILQANIKGPLWLIFSSSLYLGIFISVLLFAISIFSLIKIDKTNPEVNLIPQEKHESNTYKKRFIWCLAISFPGYAIWISAAFTTKNGGGEAYIVFIPLFFVSIIFTLPMIYYGIAYLYKKKK